MLEEKQKIEEGIDEAVTSAAPEAEPATVEEEETVSLNNSAEPTLEEKEDAGLIGDTEKQLEEQDPITEPVDEPVEGETSINNMAATNEPMEAAATATFTQSQVDEIAGRTRKETRDKTLRSVYSRYGVSSEEELDDLFGNAQRFETLQEDYDNERKSWKELDDQRNSELNALKESVALLESGIDRNRYEDAKFILKGKGLDVTVENINQELATHPEWKATVGPEAGNGESHFRKLPPQLSEKAPMKPDEPKTSISVLGNSSSDNPQPELTDRERAMKLFKV